MHPTLLGDRDRKYGHCLKQNLILIEENKDSLGFLIYSFRIEIWRLNWPILDKKIDASKNTKNYPSSFHVPWKLHRVYNFENFDHISVTNVYLIRIIDKCKKNRRNKKLSAFKNSVSSTKRNSVWVFALLYSIHCKSEKNSNLSLL